jgi:dipeptidyl-peptidase-3
VEDHSYVAPPPHLPLSEASSSSSRVSSPYPPPFSSIYFAPDSEFDHFKAAVAEAPCPPLPAFAPPPPPLSPSPSSVELPEQDSSEIAENKASVDGDKKGESSGKASDDQEPPPPYTEGFSPLESFSYVMAAAGGAASIITQVQQTAGPPINTLGGMSTLIFAPMIEPAANR